MLMIYKTLSVISPEWGALCSEEKFFFSSKKARPTGELSPSGD